MNRVCKHNFKVAFDEIIKIVKANESGLVGSLV